MEHEQRHFAWPDVPRICFGPGDPASLNACVGWLQSRPRDMNGYIEAYRQAAVALFETSVDRGTSPDFLVFPLAFLWRHHVELALKEIIAVGRQLAGEPWGFPANHRLLSLWNEARPHVIQCGDSTAPELANVEANLREFETIDPGSDGFRYPLNRDRTARSLPSAPEYVNLARLHEGMVALANFLSGVGSELGGRVAYRAEMEAEMRREQEQG